MPSDFFIERYAKERHQAHLMETALDRRARMARAPAQQLRRLMRSRTLSALGLIAGLLVMALQQLMARVGRRRAQASLQANGR
jgi:hypothetical protein